MVRNKDGSASEPGIAGSMIGGLVAIVFGVTWLGFTCTLFTCTLFA